MGQLSIYLSFSNTERGSRRGRNKFWTADFALFFFYNAPLAVINDRSLNILLDEQSPEYFKSSRPQVLLRTQVFCILKRVPYTDRT